LLRHGPALQSLKETVNDSREVNVGQFEVYNSLGRVPNAKRRPQTVHDVKSSVGHVVMLHARRYSHALIFFSSTATGALPENLQEAKVDVLTTAECHAYWSANQVTDDQVCIFDNGSQAVTACNVSRHVLSVDDVEEQIKFDLYRCSWDSAFPESIILAHKRNGC
jgi:hypothetical protein